MFMMTSVYATKSYACVRDALFHGHYRREVSWVVFVRSEQSSARTDPPTGQHPCIRPSSRCKLAEAMDRNRVGHDFGTRQEFSGSDVHKQHGRGQMSTRFSRSFGNNEIRVQTLGKGFYPDRIRGHCPVHRTCRFGAAGAAL